MEILVMKSVVNYFYRNFVCRFGFFKIQMGFSAFKQELYMSWL